MERIQSLLNRTDVILSGKKKINIEDAKKIIFESYDLFDEPIDDNANKYKELVMTYGEFLVFIFRCDIFKNEDIITLTLEYLEICVRNFDRYEDVIYNDILLKIKKCLKDENLEKFILNAIEFYIVQFGYMSSMYLSHKILNEQEEGNDTSILINTYNSYEEKDKIFSRKDCSNSFVVFYTGLTKDQFRELEEDIYEIVDTYTEVSEMISNTPLFDSFSEIIDMSTEKYQIEFINKYILDYAPSLIKHYSDNKDLDKIKNLYDLISKDFEIRNEVFKDFIHII